jgi:cyclophilin family peptidyl-prolyl cis-trans isomerase
MRLLRPTLLAVSLASLIGISACGGSGNQQPQLSTIPDLTVVAGRAIPALKLRAVDIDSTLLKYSTPEFPLETQKGLAQLNIPARSLLEFVGLTVAPVTGVISGTPKAPGKHQITITVTDSEGASDTKTFNIDVLGESLSLSFESVQAAGVTNRILQITAGDTARGGTVAYCIQTSTETPKADDPCFKTDAAGGRTASVTIRDGEKVVPYYLFTKDANGNVLSSAVPSIGVKPLVLIDTSVGAFVVELESEKTKITTENFLEYVNAGFFNNTVFHRIVSTFVVQGGGFTYNAANTPQYSAQAGQRAPIVLEKPKASGLSNTKGTIAMARTDQPDSATSQFFINMVDNSASLDTDESANPVRPGYAVFGRVIPPTGGLSNDLPPAVIALSATPVSGSLSGTGTVVAGGENSVPVNAPPFIISARRIN